MVFTRVDDYNGLTGKVSKEYFRVQTLNGGRKYLVNWNALSNPFEKTYRIVQEDVQRERALATEVKDSSLMDILKEEYETTLNPNAFDGTQPLLNPLLLPSDDYVLEH